VGLAAPIAPDGASVRLVLVRHRPPQREAPLVDESLALALLYAPGPEQVPAGVLGAPRLRERGLGLGPPGLYDADGTAQEREHVLAGAYLDGGLETHALLVEQHVRA